VAWAAEALCHATTEIEPFVLLSVHALRKQLSPADLQLYREVTAMDEKWRVVWVDEARRGAACRRRVVAMNDRPCPAAARASR